MNNAKNSVELFRVRSGHEWATIVIQGWRTELGHEQGELMVHSSYGSWGYQWSNIGRPLRQHLVHSDFYSIMGKLLGGDLREFNFEASLECWKKHLISARRRRLIDADEFRDAWDNSCGYQPCSMDMFAHRLQACDPGRGVGLWDEVSQYVVFSDNHQACAFWRDLWPTFLRELRVSADAANEPVVAMA